MAVLRKVQLLAIEVGLKIVKDGDAKRRMQLRKFELQRRVPFCVGEEEKLYGVPVEYLSSIWMKALLSRYEEEIQPAEGPVRLSCTEEMFDAVLDRVKNERRSRGAAGEDGDRGAANLGFGCIPSLRAE
ncbi:hypothetical protein MLD38_011989 [Melastoma candidum]|uniref:Uncharacterized protein n=1 Tax=Melastoma candidum TaxID=119954 RepID=A0ACB9R4G9_9MYRT|nr:hypothetical protein MLD38_011989 [Melastoma candidum]